MTLRNLLGIELPIIQAPMAGAQGSAMTIAVSNAGGLGSLPCAMLTPDALRTELRAIKAGTHKPWNVNFFCHTPPPLNLQREKAWRMALLPYYREFGVDPNKIPVGGGRAPFSEELADILEEFQPPVVSFHFGLPESRLLRRVKSWGSVILSSATTVEEALWLQEAGVDAVIAQGVEAGGHRGMFLTDDLLTQTGTLALLSQIRQRVTIPVIAAGGIAHADSVQAVLAAGAVAAQVGTAYLLCPEARITELHRQALQSDTAHITALTNLYSGRPARGIVNRLMQELGPISRVAPEFPLATAAITPLRAAAEAKGCSDFSPLWSGQDSSGCKAIPAAQLTRELAGLTD